MTAPPAAPACEIGWPGCTVEATVRATIRYYLTIFPHARQRTHLSDRELDCCSTCWDYLVHDSFEEHLHAALHPEAGPPAREIMPPKSVYQA